MNIVLVLLTLQKRLLMKKISILLASLFLANSLYAHQIVAQKEGNHYKAAFWAHGKFIDYDKHQLKGAKSYDKSAKELNTGIDFSGKSAKVLIDGIPNMITFSFDSGYWTKTMEGYKNVSPLDVKGVVFDSVKSIKFSKTIFAWNQEFTKPKGMKMEVTPLVNPLALKPGETLPVLVTLDGNALIGASFETSDNDEPTFKTDKYGIAYIPLQKKGLTIIAAKYYTPQVEDSVVENLILQSALVFNIK